MVFVHYCKYYGNLPGLTEWHNRSDRLSVNTNDEQIVIEKT